jgi:hypothetical protein
MKRGARLAIAALLMVALGAGGLYALYRGYKKFRAEQLKEYRYGGVVGEAREGFDSQAAREQILTDEFLDRVIEQHNLVSAWELDDAAEAKDRIREKFTIGLDGRNVRVNYQDKNQEIAHDILQTIVRHYYELVKAAEGQDAGSAAQQEGEIPGD